MGEIKEPWRTILKIAAIIIAGLLGGAGATQVAGCGRGPTPPIPNPDKPPPVGKKDAWNAIGKLAFQGGYCSATVIGPRMEDGRWVLVSAAHCVNRVGDSGTFIQRTGVSRNVRCVAVDKRADISIWHTDANQGEMSYTDIASGTPSPGTKVWHGGFGRHIPGNKESGEVVGGPNGDNQVQYQLSVSPGDSGGGICVDSDGHLLSPVCCTTRLDGPGRVWGGSPERIRQMVATPTEFIDLPPIAMPPPPKEMPKAEPAKK